MSIWDTPSAITNPIQPANYDSLMAVNDANSADNSFMNALSIDPTNNSSGSWWDKITNSLGGESSKTSAGWLGNVASIGTNLVSGYTNYQNMQTAKDQAAETSAINKANLNNTVATTNATYLNRFQNQYDSASTEERASMLTPAERVAALGLKGA